jgi:hypothetical protein
VVLTEARLKVLEKCFVAELSCQREAKSVQNSLVMEGIKNVKVTTMGDNLVLLQVEDPVHFELDRKEHGQWWSVVLKDIRRWSPRLVASRRRVWLKVYGISMHVGEEGFFKQIGSFFGEFMDFDEDTVTLRGWMSQGCWFARQSWGLSMNFSE